MEGGGGVHSKFMHILVQEFVSSRKYIVSYLVFFCLISFLRRIKGSQFTEPMSARIRNCIPMTYPKLVSFRDLTFLYWL